MSSSGNAQQIPTFTLYGEDQDWPTPDLLHWESVAERSIQHHWTIKPHRHSNLWQLIYLNSGSADVHIDGREQKLNQPSVLIIPQLCIHGFQFSEDVDGHVLTLSAPLLKQIIKEFPNHQTLLQNSSIVTVDEYQVPIMNALLDRLGEEYKTHQPYREVALRNLISQLNLWLVRHTIQAPQVGTNRRRNGQLIFNQFMQLVENQFRDHLALDQYAEMLKISTPHLNSVCRQYAKRSALQLIHQRLLLEAKRNLVYTAMTASEISTSLGFSEPAYFNRFFKRLSGCTPVEFRQKQ